MKHIFLILLLWLPLMGYADTDEVEVEENNQYGNPIKRSVTPKPKVYVVDRAEIRIENIDSENEIHLIIEDEANNVVYENIGMAHHYISPALVAGQPYIFTIYVANHCYVGTYLP